MIGTIARDKERDSNMEQVSKTSPKICWHVEPSMVNQNGFFIASLVSAWEKDLSITSLRLFEPWNIVNEKVHTLNTLMGVDQSQVTTIKQIHSGMIKTTEKPMSVEELLNSFPTHQRNLLDITFSDDLVIVFVRSTIQTQSLMEVLSGRNLNNVLEMAKFYFESLGHFYGLFSGQFVVERLHNGSNN